VLEAQFALYVVRAYSNQHLGHPRVSSCDTKDFGSKFRSRESSTYVVV
jgi:hypothetical protein